MHYRLGKWAKRQIKKFQYLTIDQKIEFINTKIKFKWFPFSNKKLREPNNTGLTIEEILSENNYATRYVLEELSKGKDERDNLKIINFVINQIENKKDTIIKKKLMKQMGSCYVDSKVNDFLRIAKPKYKDSIIKKGSFPKITRLDSENIKKYIRKNIVEWKLLETENDAEEESLFISLYSLALVKINKGIFSNTHR